MQNVDAAREPANDTILERERFGRRLRDARQRAGYTSASKAAKDVGIGESTYRAHENGQNLAPRNLVRRYAEAFRVPLASLLFDESYDITAAADSLPVLGSAIDTEREAALIADAQMPEGAVDDHVRLPASFLTRAGTDRARSFAVEMPDASMSPTIGRGDVVVCESSAGMCGDGLYAVATRSGQITVRRMLRGMDGRLAVAADHPAYAPDHDAASQLHFIGRVVARVTADIM